jgi:WhiB family redox-sensing transcriptional regulator
VVRHELPRHGMISDLTTTMPVLEGALCTDDPELFHPDHDRRATRAALATCDRCPSKDPCLEWALTEPYMIGILGGTTYSERRRLMSWKHRVI